MKKIDEKKARELLKKYASNNSAFQKVYQHSKAVQKAAVVIAEEIQKNGHLVDLNFIKVGCILHDIGRFECPPKTKKGVLHGVVGAQILRKEKLPKYALMAERSLGAGITKEEVIKYKWPLPKKDMIPKSIEEKIIIYADNLIFQDRIGTVSEVVQKFKREIKSPVALKLLLKLHNEIEELRGGTYFIK